MKDVISKIIFKIGNSTFFLYEEENRKQFNHSTSWIRGGYAGVTVYILGTIYHNVVPN